MKKAIKKRDEPRRIAAGLFTRKEGARLVAEGTLHVHSSALGDHDPLAALTSEALARGAVPVYPWEKPNEIHELSLTLSKGRSEAIKTISKKCGLQKKRQLRERVETALEELLTNAFFHAYHYPRQRPAELLDEQRIIVHYGLVGEGVWINVRDSGGILHFDSVANSFERCYGASETQIEHKESGAGLGLYMVFEMASHLKIEAREGAYTSISCWLVDGRGFDPKTFSFNFFQGGK